MPDLIGLGARWQGMGGGGVGLVDDGTAALLNPAGLSKVRRPTAGIGFVVGVPRFDAVPPLWWDTNRDGVVDDRDPPLLFDATPPTIRGVQLQASRHVGGKFGLGLTAYVPTNNLIRFAMFEPELPNYIMWDNRPQRFVAAAAVGGDVLPGVAIGGGVDLLARARVSVGLTADAGISGPTESATSLDDSIQAIEVDVHEIDFAVVPAFAPVAGIQLSPGAWAPALEGFVVGATWHGEVGLPIDVDLDLQANLRVEDVGELEPYVTAVVAQAQLALFDHYVPQRVQLGVAYRRSGVLAMYLDARWTDWRRAVLNVARVASAQIDSPLVDLDSVVDGNEHAFVMRSVWSARTGVDLMLPEWTLSSDWRYVRLSARGGFGYDPTPLVAQGASSALLDTDRSSFSLGAGVETWDPFELTDGAVRLDAFLQIQTLAQRTLPHASDTPTAGYPINATSIPVGGSLIAFGGQWSFEY